VIENLREILPAELKAASAESASIWPAWIKKRDAEIRARLERGEEDTLVNLLLFGISYTKRSRLTFAEIEKLAQQQANATPPLLLALQARADDLVRAAASPGNNERLIFANQVLTKRKGFDLTSPEGRLLARQYLLANVARVLNEQSGYARILAAARQQGDATEEFAVRSRLYSTRGLSFDTSLPPNYAIERALVALQRRGAFAPGSVRRVAIIGPGLDFTDKQEGYDIYPIQTIQPFALIDALLRLGLSSPKDLTVFTFDISQRVNNHLKAIVEQAKRNRTYALWLPLDTQVPWQQDLVEYWERVGQSISRSSSIERVPELKLRLRTLRVAPQFIRMIEPVELNIVTERLALPDDEKFDLVIATNVFVYYDIFDQSLAALNIERMMKKGGFLLSNNALLELPTLHLRSLGYSTTVYSERPSDGDHIVWYLHD
jgi:ribosomal protein L17